LKYATYSYKGQMYNKTDDRKTLFNKQNTGWDMNPKETLYISTGR